MRRELLKQAIKKKLDQIPGGLADKKTSDKLYRPSQLEEGVKVELEHTDDKKIAKEIAKDHLTENAEYYTHLDKMEKKMEKKARLIDELKRRMAKQK